MLPSSLAHDFMLPVILNILLIKTKTSKGKYLPTSWLVCKCKYMIYNIFHELCRQFSGMILWLCPARERRRYNVMWSLDGQTHTQNDAWVLLCFVLLWVCYQSLCIVISKFIVNPYTSGLLHWHWGNHMIAPVPVKQPWRIWVKSIGTKPYHWKLRVAMMPTLLSMLALQVVITTTSSATSHNKVGIMTTLSFQWTKQKTYT